MIYLDFLIFGLSWYAHTHHYNQFKSVCEIQDFYRIPLQEGQCGWWRVLIPLYLRFSKNPIQYTLVVVIVSS
jgi:hypothetical protein